MHWYLQVSLLLVSLSSEVWLIVQIVVDKRQDNIKIKTFSRYEILKNNLKNSLSLNYHDMHEMNKTSFVLDFYMGGNLLATLELLKNISRRGT